jgi:pyruvate dehydrogenase E2 component (dihydrolipoamide acetyltransferase)
MDFKFPDVGEGIAEGVIVKWHVKPGDHVKQDDVLCEVETDKAIVEIPSPESAVVGQIYHQEGETVEVGEVLVSYEKESGGVSDDKKAEANMDKSAKEQETSDEEQGNEGKKPVEESSLSEPPKVEENQPEPPKTEEKQPEPQKAQEKDDESSEAEQSEAKEDQGGVVGAIIDADKVKSGNTGPLFDALKHPGEATSDKTPYVADTTSQLTSNTATSKPEDKTPSTAANYGEVEEQDLSAVRKTVMKHLQKTQDEMIPVSQTHYIDVTNLGLYRKKVNAEYADDGYHFTFLPFICMGLIEAIRTYPQFNAEWDKQKEKLLIKKYINIGIAVDSEHGLFVPVVKNAHEMNIKQIALSISNLVNDVKDRSIKRDNLMGAGVTITNYGSVGTVTATPIINYPNTCILGLGAIQKVVELQGDKPVQKLKLPVTLTYDHRFIDGADTARFLNKLTSELEDPLRFNHGLIDASA